MPYTFDSNKYKKIFDNMYGSGSFDAGVNNAVKTANMKGQAQLAKAQYTMRMKQAQALQRAAEAEAKKQANEAEKEAKKKKEEAKKKKEEAKATKDLIDQYKGKSNKSKDGAVGKTLHAAAGVGEGLWNPFWSAAKSAGKTLLHAEQALNPLDHVSAKQAYKSERKNSDQFWNDLSTGKGIKSKAGKETARALNRFVDSAALGGVNAQIKHATGKDAGFNNSRSGIGNKAIDFASSGLGFLIPGEGAVKLGKALGTASKAERALKSAGAGAKLAKAGGHVASGAFAGGALEAGSEAMKGLTDPKHFNAGSAAKNIALGTAAGGALEPLFGLKSIKNAGKEIKTPKLDAGTPGKTLKPDEQLKNIDANLQDIQRQYDQAQADHVQSVMNDSRVQSEAVSPEMRQQAVQAAQDSFKRTPEAQSMQRVMNDLQHQKAQITGVSESAAASAPDSINIDAAPAPHKLTAAEQAAMRNKDIFTQNNLDPVIPDTSGHVVSKKNAKPRPSEFIDTTYTKTVDNLHPLKKFDQMVEKVTGDKLKPSESSYTLGLNSRGTDMVSKQILTDAMVNAKGEVIGKSLKDVVKGMPKGKLKEFEDYLINKHAITRMKRGEKVFPDEMKMSPEKSDAIVKAYEANNPEFKLLAKQYYEYNKQLGKAWLVDTGILTKEEWQGYLKNNPNYVPNQRLFKQIEKAQGGKAKRGFANQSNPVKKASGSQRQIISPLESTIEHTAAYVKTAKRNEVMQALIKNIQKNPEEFQGFAEIVPTDKTPQSIKDTLQKEGIGGVLENINKGFDQKPDLSKGNIVTGIIDGQKVHVRVHDPQLLEALTNITPQAQHVVFQVIGQVTRVMKNLTTGVNPIFGLTRNIFRDIPTAYANSTSKHEPVTFAKDLVAAVLDVMRNSKTYREFKNMGGGHSSPIAADVNLLAQSKRALMPQRKGLKYAGGKVLGGLENLNNAIESAPRLAEYKRHAKAGTYDSRVQGLYQANDVTTNFNRYGNVTKSLDAVIPYLNAAVQGLDKMRRQFKEHPISTVAKAVVGVTIPTVLLYAVNRNDPNYQQMSNFIKDTNYLIPNGDGTFTKIPKPRELGATFGFDVERVLRELDGQDPRAFDQFAENMVTTFLIPTRTTFAPFNDVRANKNFMGAPIVPGSLQNLSPANQYDSKTSEVGKAVGKALNTSPKNVDYLIKSYSGVLGQLGLPATTSGTTVGQTLKQQVTADPVFSNDLQSHFYDLKAKLDQAHADYTMQKVKTKDLNEPLRKLIDKRGREISALRKDMRTVQNAKSLTPQEKQKAARDIQQQINQVIVNTIGR